MHKEYCTVFIDGLTYIEWVQCLLTAVQWGAGHSWKGRVPPARSPPPSTNPRPPCSGPWSHCPCGSLVHPRTELCTSRGLGRDSGSSASAWSCQGCPAEAIQWKCNMCVVKVSESKLSITGYTTETAWRDCIIIHWPWVSHECSNSKISWLYLLFNPNPSLATCKVDWVEYIMALLYYPVKGTVHVHSGFISARILFKRGQMHCGKFQGGGGQSKSKRGQHHTKYRKANCQGGGGKAPSPPPPLWNKS